MARESANPPTLTQRTASASATVRRRAPEVTARARRFASGVERAVLRELQLKRGRSALR